MAPLDVQLGIIKKKFPEHSEHIEELYEADVDFRTLCSDDILCLQYLQKFQKEFSERRDAIEEYDSLRKELEDELQNFISREEEENWGDGF